MKKIYLLIICSFFVFGFDFFLSKTNLPINKTSYLMGFENFRNHASQTYGQRRIILVGGSSLGWGVSAEQLSSRLGILTLNSGIHGGVGFMHFMRTIEDVIDKDLDLLVISPEYSIVSTDSKFKRSNEFCELALYVLRSYPFECVGYSLTKIFKVIQNLDRVNNEEYFNDGFNQFGDYTFRIEGRDMVGRLTNTDGCKNWKISDLKDNYIPYINELRRDGYRLVYIPNFFPETYRCKDPKKIEQFHELLVNSFGLAEFESIQLLYDERYFYNSDYHLTTDGVALKTNIFESQLRSLLKSQ